MDGQVINLDSIKIKLSVSDTAILAAKIDMVLNQETSNRSMELMVSVLYSTRERFLLKVAENRNQKQKMLKITLSYFEQIALKYLIESIEWINFDSYTMTLFVDLQEKLYNS